MARKSPRRRLYVTATPKAPDIDAQKVRDHLDRPGRYRYVTVEADGSIEIGVNARSTAEAEARVERDLGDDLAPHFHIGHPPL